MSTQGQCREAFYTDFGVEKTLPGPHITMVIRFREIFDFAKYSDYEYFYFFIKKGHIYCSERNGTIILNTVWKLPANSVVDYTYTLSALSRTTYADTTMTIADT